MATRMMISFPIVLSCSSRRALADILISVIRMGITSGKLITAMRVALLSALAEIAATKVKVMEKPTLPRKSARKKRPDSCTGLPATKPKASQLSKLSASSRMVL